MPINDFYHPYSVAPFVPIRKGGNVMKSLLMRNIVLILSLGLDVSAASEYKILSGCDDAGEVRARVSKDSQINIHFSIAGYTTCYSVTVTVDGKQVQGYVLNAGLDAVREFEQARIKTTRDSFNAQVILPQPSVPISDSTVTSTDAQKSVDAELPVKEVPKIKVPVEPPR
jgi:hypothetical protein